MERWQPGEEPTIVMPGAIDPDMKNTASLPAVPDQAAKAGESGESIAAKGEVNADNQHTKTPAERLGLFDDKSAPNRKNVLPRRSISKPAAKPCAARSRWRRW